MPIYVLMPTFHVFLSCHFLLHVTPRNYMEAMQLDSENKNSKWYDAIKLEMEFMLEYKLFKKWDKAILDKHKNVMNPL